VNKSGSKEEKKGEEKKEKLSQAHVREGSLRIKILPGVGGYVFVLLTYSSFGEENNGKFKDRETLGRVAVYIGGGEYNTFPFKEKCWKFTFRHFTCVTYSIS